MTKHIKKLRNTPFDDVFRTLLEKCSKLIIPVINEIFHTKYTFNDEVITLSHSAGSKAVFAAGALKAAKFLATQAQGLYDMADVVKTD